jgi:hypothetical protein
MSAASVAALLENYQRATSKTAKQAPPQADKEAGARELQADPPCGVEDRLVLGQPGPGTRPARQPSCDQARRG